MIDITHILISDKEEWKILSEYIKDLKLVWMNDYNCHESNPTLYYPEREKFRIKTNGFIFTSVPICSKSEDKYRYDALISVDEFINKNNEMLMNFSKKKNCEVTCKNTGTMLGNFLNHIFS